MMRPIALILTLLLAVSPGCGPKKKSALERLTEKEDYLESLKFPERKPAKTEKQPTIEIQAGKEREKPAREDSEKAAEDLDLSVLQEIPEKQVSRQVSISGNHVPLRKGPGHQFDKVGVASKGDSFRLLRIQPGKNGKQTWYFVEDAAHNKFFVSSLLSSIVKEPEAKEKREAGVDVDTLQIKKSPSPRKVRTIFDPTPELPEKLKEAEHISLNFEGTELYDVITTFAELLQIDYLIEGNIQGKVTLQTFSKIPVEDLYLVLEQILALHNITVVKRGHFYRFLPIQDAARKPVSVFLGSDPNIPDQERVVIEIIHLQHISPPSMKQVLAPLLTRNATFIEVPDSQYLILVEMAYNVKRLLKVVRALDIDRLASTDIQLYKLQNAEAETVAEELEEVFSTMGYTEVVGKTITFLPLQRLNSILVVNAFENLLSTVEFWVKKLDQPVSAGEVSTFVYYVQNGDAVQLADLLTAIFPSESQKPESVQKRGLKKRPAYTTPSGKPKREKAKEKPKTTPTGTQTKKEVSVKTEGAIQEELVGEVTIIPDPDTNSLIVRTNPRNYPAIQELLGKLDLVPQQVLIEVLIIDLTLDEETRMGLEWALQDETNGTTLAGGISKTPASGGSTLGSQIGTATASFLPGGSFFVGEPNRLIALLEAFASDSKANILANPILMTTDNKAANISVTDEIPIDSTTLTTPTAGQPLTQTTVEFRSVGIKLDILPKINSDNFVNLKISQEISSQGPTVGNTPSFSTREVETEVVLKDNQVLVMGGLMRTDITTTNEGFPGLHNLPVLGFLFGSDSQTTKKTELMIFLIPHIVSSPEDSEFVTRQFKHRLGNLKQKLQPG